MLLTMQEMIFLGKNTFIDKDGKRIAKSGLSQKAKNKLLEIDWLHCLTHDDEHLITNYQDLER